MKTIFDDFIDEPHLRDKDIATVIRFLENEAAQNKRIMAQIKASDYLSRLKSGEDIKGVVNEFLDGIRLMRRLERLKGEIIDYTKMNVNEIDPITEEDVVGICPHCGEKGIVLRYPEEQWAHTWHVVKSGKGFLMCESYYSCNPGDGIYKSREYLEYLNIQTAGEG